MDPTGDIQYVTEYGKRGTLADKIQALKDSNELLTETEVLDILVQIGEGLKYAHSKDYVHKNLTPKAIYFSNDGEIKIGDWRIPEIVDLSGVFLDAGVGALYYLAPEVFEKGYHTIKSDIWSLGLLIYEIGALSKPIDGINYSFLMKNNLTNENIPHLSSPNFSPELNELLNKMLFQNPLERGGISEILESPIIKSHLKSSNSPQTKNPNHFKHPGNL